jgi:glycosyltransferase involved in cell wall biosynthesis
LPLVDRVFPDSEGGTDYLRKRYPDFTSRYETELLGVVDPGFINRASTDGVFRIVSCSMIRPEKRVERILEGIMHTARLRREQYFEWIHIGNGATRNELQKRAEKEFPSNAKAFFPGYADHATLMSLYKDKPIDVFVNLSKTEGTPVSVMEAISCGIPIIATSVGGNAEIVSGQNGILLSKDPTLDEISSAVFHLIDHPEEAQKARNGSREIWRSRYNADLNFSRFVKKLSAVRL